MGGMWRGKGEEGRGGRRNGGGRERGREGEGEKRGEGRREGGEGRRDRTHIVTVHESVVVYLRVRVIFAEPFNRGRGRISQVGER